jgi:hypothetical protein
MAAASCPRCFAALAASAAFCARCGLGTHLADPAAAAQPMDQAVGGRLYRVLDRIGVGSRSTVYRCQFGGPRSPGEGTFKVARDPVSNGALAREAEALRHLHAADPAGQFTPFLPTVLESFGYVGGRAEPPRHANVLRMHPDVRSPVDDLYTLAELRAAYGSGLDARHMAWIWRRLLTVLGFAHAHGVAHGAVLPVHVLIDPADHKLVLIGWCDATLPGRPPVSVPPSVPADYRAWVSTDRFPSFAADLRLAARCMADLLGRGDGDRPDPAVDPAIARHLDRAVNAADANAWQLRAEFDQLIEALWGPRQFRPLTMPPKRHSV